MAVRSVWRVPWTTHCNLLPHIAGVMPPELSLAKRSVKFITKLIKSDNMTVKTITGMGLYSQHSFVGKNFRHLSAKYEMDTNNILKAWDSTCRTQVDVIRISEQIKELCFMRDSYQPFLLNKSQLRDLVNYTCTM